MSFIATVSEADASPAVHEMYETDRAAFGALPNLTRAFSHRPEIYAAWRQLNGAIKAGMDLRRYELATIAAARELRSSYCMLAHGKILAAQFFSEDEVRAIAAGDPSAPLDETDRAVMELATLVARDAPSITTADIDRARAVGLGDEEIFDVVCAATARCFFSTTLDALGVQPDAHFAELPEVLRDALVVGRPIAT